jgi:hypothetical protein
MRYIFIKNKKKLEAALPPADWPTPHTQTIVSHIQTDNHSKNDTYTTTTTHTQNSHRQKNISKTLTTYPFFLRPKRTMTTLSKPLSSTTRSAGHHRTTTTMLAIAQAISDKTDNTQKDSLPYQPYAVPKTEPKQPDIAQHS